MKALKDYAPGSIVNVDGVWVKVVDGSELADSVFDRLLSSIFFGCSREPVQEEGDEVCGVDCGCVAPDCKFEVKDDEELDSQEQMEFDIAKYMQELHYMNAVVRCRGRSADTGELTQDVAGDYTITAYKDGAVGPEVFVCCCGWKTFDQLCSDFFIVDDEGSEVCVCPE